MRPTLTTVQSSHGSRLTNHARVPAVSCPTHVERLNACAGRISASFVPRCLFQQVRGQGRTPVCRWFRPVYSSTLRPQTHRQKHHKSESLSGAIRHASPTLRCGGLEVCTNLPRSSARQIFFLRLTRGLVGIVGMDVHPAIRSVWNYGNRTWNHSLVVQEDEPPLSGTHHRTIIKSHLRTFLSRASVPESHSTVPATALTAEEDPCAAEISMTV